MAIKRASELAVCFRNAIAVAVAQGRLESRQFDGFPRGVCGDSAQMLGQYLQDSGFGVWSYRSGVDGSGQTHAWIEKDGWIIDITAPQFDGVSESVVVTDDPSWYRRFTKMASYPYADLSAVGPAMPALRRDYQLLRVEADRACRHVTSTVGARTGRRTGTAADAERRIKGDS